MVVCQRFVSLLSWVLLAGLLFGRFSSPATNRSSPGQPLLVRVSVDSSGREANGPSRNPSISADGRYVVFESDATNLVRGDTNGMTDVFLYDTRTGETYLVSAGQDGTPANGKSWSPTISADGYSIAFYSDASNLVSGDTNGHGDTFIYKRISGTIERVSLTSDGSQGNADSTWYNGPSLSADGRFVAFVSTASNLVSGDTNAKADVFVRDRLNGTTERVSIASDGNQGNDYSDQPLLSADGRYISFFSVATNMVPGDTNGVGDIFVRDRVAGVTRRVSVASGGGQANGWNSTASMSPDGRYVAFQSLATNLVSDDTNGVYDVYVHDLWTGTTERVSIASDGRQGDGDSGTHGVAISADGRFVAFASLATNLVSGDTNKTRDVFIHDRKNGVTERISQSTDGEGDGESWIYLFPGVAFSRDGRRLVFQSRAANLVSGDSNRTWDIFLWTAPPLSFPEAGGTILPVGEGIFLAAILVTAGLALRRRFRWR